MARVGMCQLRHPVGYRYPQEAGSPCQRAPPVLVNGPRWEVSRRQPEGGLVHLTQLLGRETKGETVATIITVCGPLSPMTAMEGKHGNISLRSMIRIREY